MVDLTYGAPPNRPPATDAERVEDLHRRVIHAAHSHWVHTMDFKFFGTVARLGSIVGVFAALALVERSPHAAWWWLVIVLALLALDIVFNPAEQALRHARREGALREMAADLGTIETPIYAASVERYDSRAKQLIARD